MTVNDIQGNSWTDEPELPNTKREGQGEGQRAPDKNVEKQADEKDEPSSVQRPPSDS